MKLRKLLFGDMPTYQVIEEVVGGIAFLALSFGFIFFYIML